MYPGTSDRDRGRVQEIRPLPNFFPHQQLHHPKAAWRINLRLARTRPATSSATGNAVPIEALSGEPLLSSINRTIFRNPNGTLSRISYCGLAGDKPSGKLPARAAILTTRAVNTMLTEINLLFVTQ
jgi:hypothetical protein